MGRERARQRSVDAAFRPTDLSNLEFWVRSDLGLTLNGSNVTTWADQSGNSRELTQGTDSRPPSEVQQ